MGTILLTPDRTLTSLRLKWAWAGLAFAGVLLSGFFLLRLAWLPIYSLRWVLLVMPVGVYQLIILWHYLADNHRRGEVLLLPTLGAGTALTLLRGMLLAALAGFLFAPRPAGVLAWLPGLLYTLVGLADLFDGYLARSRDHATLLGERLDLSMDGLGVLLSSALLVQYGQAPVAFLLVGLARYLYLLGIWLRQRFNLPVNELDDTPMRRPLAGLQMGFIAVALLPLFSPPAIRLVASLFTIPFLVNFFRDWLVASGMLKPKKNDSTNRPPGNPITLWLFTNWVPVILRGALLIIITRLFVVHLSLYQSAFHGELSNWVLYSFLLMFFGLFSLLLGAAGRFGALAVLFSLGFQQHFLPLGGLEYTALVLGIGIVHLGTGRFSSWVPENRLIQHRLGESMVRGS